MVILSRNRAKVHPLCGRHTKKKGKERGVCHLHCSSGEVRSVQEIVTLATALMKTSSNGWSHLCECYEVSTPQTHTHTDTHPSYAHVCTCTYTCRETDWLFSSDGGRKQLAESAGFERLVVVTLHRAHTYTGVEGVREEVGGRAVQLVQGGVAQEKQVSLREEAGAVVYSFMYDSLKRACVHTPST